MYNVDAFVWTAPTQKGMKSWVMNHNTQDQLLLLLISVPVERSVLHERVL